MPQQFRLGRAWLYSGFSLDVNRKLFDLRPKSEEEYYEQYSSNLLVLTTL